MLKILILNNIFLQELVFIVLLSFVANAETIQIDLKDYVYQSPADNMMICQNDHQTCSQGFFTKNNEFINVYSNGTFYYVARSTTLPYLVGVVKYVDQTDPSLNQRGQLRCFGQESLPCSDPPDVAFPPQGAPQVFNVNIASTQDELNADNLPVKFSDGSPRQPIAGSISLTNNQQLSYSLNILDRSTCSQTFVGNLSHQVLAVFVRKLYFGGDLGYQDALIIDEYENGPSLEQHHMERYYYVRGYGRVREGASFYNPETMVYDKPIYSSTKNIILPSNIIEPDDLCPQGSALLQ